ncbi:MAG: hypothetical protein MJA83_11265, partial [Gammaproteobacteria bacterium]|nr:hypothetical protein [Gammaproteobacteria bacterium]
ASIETYNLDHWMGASASGLDVADDSALAQLVSDDPTTADWDTFDNETDALEALQVALAAAQGDLDDLTDGQILISTTIATHTSDSDFTLTAGSADDNAYNNRRVIIRDAATANQVATGRVLDYTGSTKRMLLQFDPGIFALAVTDKVIVLAGEL